MITRPKNQKYSLNTLVRWSFLILWSVVFCCSWGSVGYGQVAWQNFSTTNIANPSQKFSVSGFIPENPAALSTYGETSIGGGRIHSVTTSPDNSTGEDSKAYDGAFIGALFKADTKTILGIPITLNAAGGRVSMQSQDLGKVDFTSDSNKNSYSAYIDIFSISLGYGVSYHDFHSSGDDQSLDINEVNRGYAIQSIYGDEKGYLGIGYGKVEGKESIAQRTRAAFVPSSISQFPASDYNFPGKTVSSSRNLTKEGFTAGYGFNKTLSFGVRGEYYTIRKNPYIYNGKGFGKEKKEGTAINSYIFFGDSKFGFTGFIVGYEQTKTTLFDFDDAVNVTKRTSFFWSFFAYEDVRFEGIDLTTGEVIEAKSRIFAVNISLCMITEGKWECKEDDDD